MKRKRVCSNCGTKLRRHLSAQKTIDFWFCDVCGLKIGSKESAGKFAIAKIMIFQRQIESQKKAIVISN